MLLPYAPCAKSFSPLPVIQPQTHFKQVLNVVADALIGKDVETKRKKDENTKGLVGTDGR